MSLSPVTRCWKLEFSNGVVDAVETVAEMAQQFGRGRFGGGGEIADAELGADQRHHGAETRRLRVGQAGDVDREQIHRRRSGNGTALPADDHVELVVGWAYGPRIAIGISPRNPPT